MPCFNIRRAMLDLRSGIPNKIKDFVGRSNIKTLLKTKKIKLIKEGF